MFPFYEEFSWQLGVASICSALNFAVPIILFAFFSLSFSIQSWATFYGRRHVYKCKHLTFALENRGGGERENVGFGQRDS